MGTCSLPLARRFAPARIARRRIFVIAALVGLSAMTAGCGSNDGDDSEESSSIIQAEGDEQATEDETSMTEDDDETSTTEDDDETSTTEDDDETSTTEDGDETSTTEDDDETSTTEEDDGKPTEDDSTTGDQSAVVGEALAEQLLDANLYSIPGLRSACDPLGLDSYPDPIYVSYLFAARGGDIYELCIVPPGNEQRVEKQGTLEPATLQVRDALGRTVVDVSVTEYDAWEAVASGQAMGPGSQLVVGYEDGTRRVHGMQIHWPNTVVIPIFVPHDRPAGTWSVDYSSASGSRSTNFEVDAPCVGVQPSLASSDPLDFADVQFVRSQDVDGYSEPAPIAVPFEHCRLAPDVVGMQASDAIVVLENYAAVNGKTTEVVTRECEDGTVLEQGPPAGSLYRSELYRSIMGRPEAEDQQRPTGVAC